jgi:GAF domain-containing protein
VNSIVRFSVGNGGGEPMKTAGVLAGILSKCESMNCTSAMSHMNSSEEVDSDEPLLGIPVMEMSGRVVYATVLRGPRHRRLFTPNDEEALRRLAPFVTLAVANSLVYTNMDREYQKGRMESEGLAALLEVAETVSGHLDMVRLTEVIMEKGRSLTHADRCSLFLVNDRRDRLITSFQDGLEGAIDIPIDKGIAGETVKRGKVMMIHDAYDSPSFDSSVDMETGYRTRSLLSVPIFGNSGDVIGVTEMVNKSSGDEDFTKWDSHMIKIFNVFSGIALENAKMYRESQSMLSQLRSFFDVSFSLSKSESVHRILSDIIHNARQAMRAERASLFLLDESAGLLTSFLLDGGVLPPTLPLTSGIVGHCATHKVPMIVNNVYEDPRFNRSIDLYTGFVTKSLCVSPIISSTGSLLGVCEMVNKAEEEGGFNEHDMKLLESFTTFASFSLENSRLKDLANAGTSYSELPKYIPDVERSAYTIPLKLMLLAEKQREASSLSFYALNWRGIPEIQLFFFLFQKFDIFDSFKITNELFFRYLLELRNRYNDVPYHNWIHAGDVTQYVCYEMQIANMKVVLTRLEIFAILVAATGHDVNHDGFNNVYKVQVETPLGILFKDQSVMETHHCSQLIDILSKDEFNLLQELSASENRKVWTLMIKLILATDMVYHFRLVREVTHLLDGPGVDMNDPDQRLLMMQMLLKTADISNVSRPFKIADKWCDVLEEEIIQQSDKKQGQGLDSTLSTSPPKDREHTTHSNRPKMQIGFYNFICIPLYSAVARVWPQLEINLRSVRANLERWKKMAASVG